MWPWTCFSHFPATLMSMCVLASPLPLPSFLRSPPGDICIEWSDFCLQKGKIFTNSASLLFQLELFSPGKTAFCLAKMDVQHWRKRKAVFVAKKTAFCFCQKKQNIWDKPTNISLFANSVKTWFFFHQRWEYFPTRCFLFLKIMVSVVEVTNDTCTISLIELNIMNIISKHVEYMSGPMWRWKRYDLYPGEMGVSTKRKGTGTWWTTDPGKQWSGDSAELEYKGVAEWIKTCEDVTGQ